MPPSAERAGSWLPQAVVAVVLGGAYHRSTGLVLPAATLACLLLPGTLPARSPAR